MKLEDFKKLRLAEIAEDEAKEAARRNYKTAKKLTQRQLCDLICLHYLGRGDYGVDRCDSVIKSLLKATADPQKQENYIRDITSTRPFLDYLKDGIELVKDNPQFKESIALFQDEFIDASEFCFYSMAELAEEEFHEPEYMAINRNKAKALPPEKLYDLVFLMYLGRGDNDLDYYEEEMDHIKTHNSPDEWARHITEKVPFEEYLERGIELAKDDPRFKESIALFLETFAIEKPCDHKWFVYSTALREGWLMLECNKCGSLGTVENPTKEEWNKAFDAPSKPYVWEDHSRVEIKSGRGQK